MKPEASDQLGILRNRIFDEIAIGDAEGGVLDGPLAFDNAVSLAAARVKGIVSPVAVMPARRYRQLPP